ncbi:MAG: S8 family serine peptidase [Nitrospirae bacterium]|nr:S8 family serine peptidase [Nitrospirota bacterium]
MKRKTKKVFCIILFTLFCFISTDFSFSKVHSLEVKNSKKGNVSNLIDVLLSSEHVEGEILVKFRNEIAVNNALLKSVSNAAHLVTGGSVKKEFKRLRGLQLVSLGNQISVSQALESYINNPDIEYAEPNYIVHSTAMPDDTYFNQLWGLNNTGQTGGTVDADIDAPEAWELTTGSSDVVIAVVDTGISYNHPELSANIWYNPGETSCTDGIDNDGNGYVDDCYGWDFVDNDNDPMGYASHGTHVAGTIAAVGNNTQGVAGVMWTAKIMPLRFLDAIGSGTTADAISAILYANAKGAHVINNSWGGGGFSQALKDAIDASPAVVVCAAGNSTSNNDSAPFYPASYTSANIIAVAATDHNDNLAWFSSYGATSVDVAAPGVSIYSTVPARHQLFFDNMTTLNNWTAQSPWGLSTIYFSSPYSASDSPTGNYANNTNTSLKLANLISLTGERGTVLEYWLRLQTQSYYDFLCVDASTNGNSWTNLNCYYGSTGSSFYFMEEDLTSYDGRAQFYIRFRLQSNNSVTDDGAYIDDVKITSYSADYTGTEYAYYSGTSMATPHVSGLAGLIKSLYPFLTNLEIKAAILNNVDTKSSLTGKVLTDGRINAFKALSSITCPYFPVMIARITPAYFSSLQAAYNAAVEGETIQSQALNFTEDLNININKSVTVEGGYNCDYSTVIGMTRLTGLMTTSYGTITIGNLELKQ